MGLMGTLAKVAIGYATARGVDKLAGGGGLNGLLGGGAQVKGKEPASEAQAQMGQMMSGKMPEGAANPMQDMMSKFQDGGLGAMMGALGGGAGGTANPMAEMMEKLQGGFDMSALTGGGSDGSQGGILSSMGGGAGLAGMMAAAGAASQGQGLGGILDSFNTKDTAPEAEEAAGLMLRAMIQAAKCDGDIDAAEKAKLLDTIGADADPEDLAFVQDQLVAHVDAAALAADTPEAQRMQVYSASLMTIRVDTAAEAQYLDSLAKAMGLDEATVNTLHMQMGIQPLYN
ncbi:DUF533 domain-containing protein [Pelagimonas varians]|uniref:Inner membrane protein YebE n=1 Tax=Pelagimonas varians TaxID=696760 RepID=A0A238JU77_9RHOB|nr:DUF533 domain-containing protein [Pelagimonas varians]PYG34395.1 uncharacterized membrane protein YebE (DUF533 family) [Pelagimonas varians]SMX34199.1 hypothetical protein PEV8663_00421 [Pelagimonas varians]